MPLEQAARGADQRRPSDVDSGRALGAFEFHFDAPGRVLDGDFQELRVGGST